MQPTDAAPARPKNWTVAVELMKLLTPSFQTTQGEKVDRLHRYGRTPEQSPKAWYTVWAGHLQAARPYMPGGDDEFTLAAKALGCINGGQTWPTTPGCLSATRRARRSRSWR